MTNAFSLFRSLIIYSVCLPLAIYVGYLMATPDTTSFVTVGILLMLLTIPMFLRWHFPWLIFCWNSTMGLYFLPGKPSMSLFVAFVSFGISMLAYIMNRNLKFISVPSLTRPLIFLSVVVLATAELTGGIALNIFGGGSEGNIGGKRYIFLMAAVVGYFALTAHRIPEQKGKLYSRLYFLGSATSVIGNLAAIVTPSFYFIFLIFPADLAGSDIAAASTPIGTTSITRFSAVSATATALLSLMFAFYGIQGIFTSRKYWRIGVFCCLVVMVLMGGYRSAAITLILTFGILFYLEGLVRSRLMPIFTVLIITGGALILPFTDKLPLSIQRSMTFVPGINLDPEAVFNAKSSTDWRIQMWQEVLPEVPQYLILGKGYGINAHDLDLAARSANRDSQTGAMMAGDYHNGPLSVIMPFGIFGVLAFLWFLAAGTRVLYRNYKYGDPEQQFINRYLLTFFIVRIIMFMVVFGSLYSDMMFFCGVVGFSVALNGGMRGPVVEPVTRPAFSPFRIAGATR